MEQGKIVTIQDVTQEIYVVFDTFNQEFFYGDLPAAALTIQSTLHKKRTMGWCTRNPVWSFENGENQLYEINLSAEFLDQGFYETMDTLLHEMVHLYFQYHEIQDVSRKGQYHNKRFKEKVLELGYIYTTTKPDPYVGWGAPRIGDKLKERIAALDINQNVFRLARYGSTYLQLVEDGTDAVDAKAMVEFESLSAKSKSGSIKYTCPGCHLIIRSYKKDIEISCNQCDRNFISE